MNEEGEHIALIRFMQVPDLSAGHRMHKGYEEITVPAVKQASMGDNETLVAIATLPEWAQTAFQGYKCAPPRTIFAAYVH